MNFFNALRRKQENKAADAYGEYIKRLDSLDPDKANDDKALERLMDKLDITPDKAQEDYHTIQQIHRLYNTAKHLEARQTEHETARADCLEAKAHQAAEIARLRQEVSQAESLQRNAKRALEQSERASNELRAFDPKMLNALGIDL